MTVMSVMTAPLPEVPAAPEDDRAFERLELAAVFLPVLFFDVFFAAAVALFAAGLR